MRLRLFFFLIIIYVIAAFGWLTYSLVRFSHNEYKLKDQILKAGMQACVLRIIEKGKNDEFVSSNAEIYRLRQIEMRVDTVLLNRYLKSYNYGSYEASYVALGRQPMIEIGVSAQKEKILDAELSNKIRLYVFEAILLTILVGAGIYGVYSSVQMIYNLNKQQNNFLLSVTHELKTPIAAMKLMLQTIRRRALPEAKREELMDKAIANADRLNELTENMLTAMQIENDRYTYDRSEFSLSEMMVRLMDHYSLHNEISCEIQPDIYIIGDLFIIRISVNNLVENAIKYSDNQPIHLRLFTRKNKAVIEVHDQGRGVPESERKRIFKRFYRVEDEEVRDTKGTGLGLFIVKQSIEKHKGTVQVLPNNPQGSIFRIELPLPKNE